MTRTFAKRELLPTYPLPGKRAPPKVLRVIRCKYLLAFWALFSFSVFEAEACKVGGSRWTKSKASLFAVMEKVEKMKKYDGYSLLAFSVGTGSGFVENKLDLGDGYGKCLQLIFSVKQPVCALEVEFLREQSCGKDK